MLGSLTDSAEEGSPLPFWEAQKGQPLIFIYLRRKTRKEKLRVGRKRVPRLNA
jgi:hypothetical protein